MTVKYALNCDGWPILTGSLEGDFHRTNKVYAVSLRESGNFVGQLRLCGKCLNKIKQCSPYEIEVTGEDVSTKEEKESL